MKCLVKLSFFSQTALDAPTISKLIKMFLFFSLSQQHLLQGDRHRLSPCLSQGQGGANAGGGELEYLFAKK